MYAEITAISYNAKKNEVIINATDLDQILLNDWDQDISDRAEATFKFDLTARGHRVYLYKICRNNVRIDCKNMVEMLDHLTGKILNISTNFLQK